MVFCIGCVRLVAEILSGELMKTWMLFPALIALLVSSVTIAWFADDIKDVAILATTPVQYAVVREVRDINEEAKEEFTNMPSGSLSTRLADGKVIRGVHYGSWYEPGKRIFHYRVRNLGNEEICVRSELFPRLLHVRAIRLSPGKEFRARVFASDRDPALPPETKDAIMRLSADCLGPYSMASTIGLLAP